MDKVASSRFVYDGEVWANQYGLALKDRDWQYLQQELADRLGMHWTNAADWRGILRIEVTVIDQTPDRQLDATASDRAHAPIPIGAVERRSTERRVVERRQGDRRQEQRRRLNLGGYVPPE